MGSPRVKFITRPLVKVTFITVMFTNERNSKAPLKWHFWVFFHIYLRRFLVLDKISTRDNLLQGHRNISELPWTPQRLVLTFPRLQKGAGSSQVFQRRLWISKILCYGNICVGAPYITSSTPIDERRRTFSQIAYLSGFKSKIMSKFRFYINFKGAGRRLNV